MRDREINRQMRKKNGSSLSCCCVSSSVGASKGSCIHYEVYTVITHILAMLQCPVVCPWLLIMSISPCLSAATRFNLDNCGVILYRSSSFNTGAQSSKRRFSSVSETPCGRDHPPLVANWAHSPALFNLVSYKRLRRASLSAQRVCR